MGDSLSEEVTAYGQGDVVPVPARAGKKRAGDRDDIRRKAEELEAKRKSKNHERHLEQMRKEQEQADM